jgi:hypothetical protein
MLLVFLAVSAGAGSAAGATSRPRLAIEDQQPLLVAGSAFEARELVTVRALGTFGTRTLRVRATTAGTFRLRFRRLTADPCSLRRLIAVGTLGSRAAIRLPPGACAELGSPPG